MDVRVVRQDELPLSNIARELVGTDHGGLGACIIFVDAPPGRGPSPHTHPYEEVLVILDGEASVMAGERELVVGAGDVVIVPANTPHAFTNTGGGPLRQIDIHLSPSFSTEWL
jgi:mannose-6-phosphate isomerase-like protein (cupin superfamily)